MILAREAITAWLVESPSLVADLLLEESGRTSQRGKSVQDAEGKKYVMIYRARGGDDKTFKDGDYVTLSKKWAKEHADHSVWVHEETQVVIRAMVPGSRVFEAPNPGEYFYFGPPVTGKVIYKIDPE